MSQEENNLFGFIGENKLQPSIRIIPVELGNYKGGILVISRFDKYSFDNLWNRLSELFTNNNSKLKDVSKFVRDIVSNYESNIQIINKYYENNFIDYLPNIQGDISRVRKLLLEFNSKQNSQVSVGNQNPVINTQMRANLNSDSTH